MWVRLLGSLGAGLGSAVLLAMALTVVDLYQAGLPRCSGRRSCGVAPRRDLRLAAPGRQ